MPSMPVPCRVRDRTVRWSWLVIGCTACGCSSTHVTRGGGGRDGSATTTCENMAGTWDVTACGVSGQCTIAQSTCALSVACSAFLVGQGTASGTITMDDFTFTSNDGSCTGTVSGTVLAGTCKDADGGSSC